jgi:CRISPR-associated protein Csx16
MSRPFQWPEIPMQRTLITFIGTHRYSETVYRWQDVGEYKSAHIAAALARLWKATNVVVLATKAAEEKNGAALRDSLAAANLPEPLFKRLPDGRTQEELWTQFQVMREAIQLAGKGDVLVDITHGFRAQPFFAGAVATILRAAGEAPNSLSLVYGEYREHEAASPIWDLTLFAELMDWAQAIGLFLRTGVAAPVVQLSEQVRRREAERTSASNTPNFPRFGQLTKAIERFANDLATIRVASIITGYEQEDSRKRNACGSAANLLAAIEQCRQEVADKLPPLALILDELAERVRPLTAHRLFDEGGQRAQHALARHYLSLARYSEAAVVVREARISRHAQDEAAVEVNSPCFDQKQRSGAEDRFIQEDPDARAIADIRNDIEHGGFRKQPLSGTVLRQRIEQLVERFCLPAHQGEVEDAKASPCAGGRTLFVTRHPGAVEWCARQGIAVDRTVEHLELAEVQPGDVVIGTLPVHVVAEVCSRGARYLHLALELPAEQRGRELTAEEMVRFGARLVEHRVESVSSD